MKKDNWEIFLAAAKTSAAASDESVKETFLRSALEFAVDKYGQKNASTGICLMELADFLEENGKSEEAEILTLRYKAILCRYAQEYGIGS